MVPDHDLGRRKLAFPGNSFEGFGRALDPVLTVVAIRRKQANDFIGTGRSRTRHIARSEINRRSYREFVLQRPLRHANKPAARHGPRCVHRPRNTQIFL